MATHDLTHPISALITIEYVSGPTDRAQLV